MERAERWVDRTGTQIWYSRKKNKVALKREQEGGKRDYWGIVEEMNPICTFAFCSFVNYQWKGRPSLLFTDTQRFQIFWPIQGPWTINDHQRPSITIFKFTNHLWGYSISDTPIVPSTPPSFPRPCWFPALRSKRKGWNHDCRTAVNFDGE